MKTRGFTLIEILMVITLIAVLSAASVSLYTNSLDDARFEATYVEMLQLRKAIIGDLENTSVEGERMRFGYLGDMGSIPTGAQGLAALYSLPAGASMWAVNPTANLGVGWNGPYIVSSTNQDYKLDAWGNEYIYNTTAGVPYILSFGSDGLPGGTGTAEDIQVNIPLNIRTGRLTGQIVSSGSVYTGSANVELFYPSGSGVLTSQEVNLGSSDEGQFVFNNIPFGVRSLKVSIPDKVNPAIVLGPTTFAMDHENFILQSTFLEVNPTSATEANCNTITNITYVPGSLLKEPGTFRVKFKLNIQRSFSMNSFYLRTNGTRSNSNRIVRMGLGGVVYGCYGGLSRVINKNTLNRKFAGCTQGTNSFLALTQNLDGNPNVSLLSAWGVASGQNVPVFIEFNDQSSGGNDATVVNTISEITLHLGCDRLTIN
jgi:general secretion pathway protein G